MVRKANKKTRFSKSKRKKLDHRTNKDCRKWADLPDDLLDTISKRMNFVEYLAFGGVCKSWRSVAVAHRQNFMASQPPFMVLISVYAKRACSLFNIADKTKCKTMLPNLVGRSCWGFSCGYLIMRDRSFKLGVINLITREELHFPVLPEFFRQFLTPDFRTILAYSTVLSQFVMVFAHRSYKLLYFCQAGGVDWTVYSFADKPWFIVDLAVFDGKIYVLTDHARIGIFKLWPHPDLMLLDVKGTPIVCSQSLQLVTSNEQLLMLDFRSLSRIYKLDRTRMQWVVLESLGQAALFVNSMQSAIVSNPSKWGGQSNCIYYMDGKGCQSFPFHEEHRVEHRPFFWYFPHQSQNKNLLQDDDISGSD